MVSQKVKEKILKAYTTVGHPAAFSSANRLYDHFKKKISLKDIQLVLQSSEAKTLHYKPKKPRIFNPFYIFTKRQQIQADLIDTNSLAEHNNGIRYLFCAIGKLFTNFERPKKIFLFLISDSFTKKLWVKPLLRKDANSMVAMFDEWLSSLKKLPQELYVDLGKEFFSNKVLDILKKFNVKLTPSYAWNKASYAERVQRSLQLLMYTYMTDKDTLTYIDVLPQLVKTYNNRKHRSLKGLTPNEADKAKNQLKVRDIHMTRYAKILEKRKKIFLKVGSLVRIKKTAGVLSRESRGYTRNFNEEIFMITRISKRQPIPKYHLKSLKDLEPILGTFYREELSPLKNLPFKIKKVLRKKGKGKNRQALVTYRDLDPKYNQWIPIKNVPKKLLSL